MFIYLLIVVQNTKFEFVSQDYPKVAIVILNYNTRKLLQKFLPSVALVNYPNLEVVIADNASTDKSLDFVTEYYPEYTTIKLDKNYGYAGGYNKALEQVKADYYVLLNSDVEVTADFIQPCIEAMQADEKLAAVQPKILDFYNKYSFEYAGAAGGFIDKYGYPFCRGRLFDNLEPDDHQYDEPINIFWATGACLFIKAAIFKQAGGFDEELFAHMEEIDLCWRLQNMGYKLQAIPQSVIYHVGGGTLSQQNSHKTFLNFRNGLVIMLKNLPKKEAFVKICYRLVLDHIAAYRFLFTGKLDDFKAVAKAHFQFLTKLGKWKKPGKQHTNRKHLAELNGVYNKSLVVNYFLKGKKKFSDLEF